MSNEHTYIDPMDLVQELSSLPHRGAATRNESRAAEILLERLRSIGARCGLQPVRTPRTYLSEVWWLLGSLIAGLLLVPVLRRLTWPWLAVTVYETIRYFDWRETPVSTLPPRYLAHNVLANFAAPGKPTKRLVLMAHYDSAPVSRLYLPSTVRNVRASLLLSLALTILALVVAVVELLEIGLPLVTYLRYALVAYFVVQGILSSIDYWRLGFTNGAADNATGTAVAVAVAQRLWHAPMPGWRVELVLTSAEEANLKGSLAYLKTNGPFERTHVLNFDNVGTGCLKVITRTGTLTPVNYDNALVDAALAVASSDARFAEVEPASWHIGDFDTLWFARAGVSSLTISAQNDQGLIPNLHRPEDTLDNVEPRLVHLAADFGEAVARKLAAQQS